MKCQYSSEKKYIKNYIGIIIKSAIFHEWKQTKHQIILTMIYIGIIGKLHHDIYTPAYIAKSKIYCCSEWEIHFIWNWNLREEH
jgi:hypothetical protein